MKVRTVIPLVLGTMLSAQSLAETAKQHNLVLLVPDGLRSQIVSPETAPTLARLREEGVDFRNSHSLYPTFTTANASALATGHQLGDTGDFSNGLYTGFAVQALNGTVTPFLENDAVLREVNSHFDGNYLNEPSILAAARAEGYGVAVIGKLGPAAIFDLAANGGEGALIIDDSTGVAGKGIPLSAEWQAAFDRAKVPRVTPSRADNGNAGDAAHPGTWIPDLAQEQYFLEVAVKVVLPFFSERHQPFVLVFWSRDPDGTQHNQGDSFHRLSPGINGPTSLSAVRNVDGALATLEQALRALGIFETTNIIVAADHGFSTISRQSATSPSRQPLSPYKDVAAGELPPGFLAIDLLGALSPRHPQLKLFDPDDGAKEIDWRHGQHPVRGNALLGADAGHPDLVIAADGGSDLLYVRPPGAASPLSKGPRSPTHRASRADTQLVREIIEALLREDYVSGIFVDRDRFGVVPGALATQDVGLSGAAVTPHPDLNVNFTSRRIEGCERAAVLCAAVVSDSPLQTGQGMHGSFSRADTWNFMAARGPDFRQRYLDPLPASNADVGMTIAHLLRVSLQPRGRLTGRLLSEALSSGSESADSPAVVAKTLQSQPAQNGLKTLLRMQSVGPYTYFDAAGFPGRTVGLDESAEDGRSD